MPHATFAHALETRKPHPAVAPGAGTAPPQVPAKDARQTAQLDQTDTTWHQELRDAIRDPAELCRLLDLPAEIAAHAAPAIRDFPLFVPRDFLARMRPGDPRDPLLMQVLPTAAETTIITQFSPDPVGDLAAVVTPGLLHKYPGRALLILTGACAVHCRYCFRRHFPYAELPRSLAQWRPALDHLAADNSLSEIILSGGDPLILRDELLGELATQLATIPHLRRLRVHTRLPIMIPRRVTDELLGWLRGTRLSPIMVVHANHPAELVSSAAAALRRLVQAGIPTLNQAVLLRGINDSAAVQAELSARLLDLGVLPYYLHQLDRVAGGAHFEVPISTGLQILGELQATLPGYAVPRYVQEVPGARGKTPLV
ncbi:MAG: EF-P beta-lysylation protein EpmB [Pirellulales bacterium]|nr:EF-P beta-lysylation protein EpmB [Pirellulales bacterium]